MDAMSDRRRSRRSLSLVWAISISLSLMRALARSTAVMKPAAALCRASSTSRWPMRDLQVEHIAGPAHIRERVPAGAQPDGELALGLLALEGCRRQTGARQVYAQAYLAPGEERQVAGQLEVVQRVARAFVKHNSSGEGTPNALAGIAIGSVGLAMYVPVVSVPSVGRRLALALVRSARAASSAAPLARSAGFPVAAEAQEVVRANTADWAAPRPGTEVGQAREPGRNPSSRLYEATAASSTRPRRRRHRSQAARPPAPWRRPAAPSSAMRASAMRLSIRARNRRRPASFIVFYLQG